MREIDAVKKKLSALENKTSIFTTIHHTGDVIFFGKGLAFQDEYKEENKKMKSLIDEMCSLLNISDIESINSSSQFHREMKEILKAERSTHTQKEIES